MTDQEIEQTDVDSTFEVTTPLVEVCGAFTRAERKLPTWEQTLNEFCARVGYTTDRRDMFWRMESDGRLVLFRRNEG